MSVRLLLFVLIELVLFPVSLVGVLLYMTAMFRCRRLGASYTAYEPLGARVVLDAVAARPDPAARPLLSALPTSSAVGAAMVFGPTLLALRASGYRPGFATYPVELPSSVMTLMSHRTQFLDAAIEAALDRVEQVAILGAGWDTRAVGMLRGVGIRVFEVDTPATQAVKRAGMERAGLDDAEVTYVAVDFNRERWLERLRDEGWDSGKRSFVLWEGVTYYLDAEAAAATLRAVGDLAPGSEVAFDYFTGDVPAGGGPKQLARARRWLDWLGEPWTFGLPADEPPEAAARAFVEAQGLRLVRHEPFGPPGEVFGGVVLASVPE